MISRFRIEDLISQDSGSVVYLGVDGKTGERAALRRFFLGDGESDGIAEEDQAAFTKAMALLTQVDHPCLRKVLEGGIDEVDGVPYAATQWVEGSFLREVLEEGPISVEAGDLLVRQGLDVIEHLESYFGDGAHWLKLHPDSVIVEESEERVSFTFSISLDRWMGIEPGEGGLHELAALVERSCGLSRETMLGRGGALGEWVRHVRVTSPGVSDARGALDFIVRKHEEPGAETPTLLVGDTGSQAPKPVAPPVRMPPPPAKSHGVAITLSVLATLVLLGGGFLFMKSRGGEIAAREETAVEVASEAAASAENRKELAAEASSEGPDLPVVVEAESGGMAEEPEGIEVAVAEPGEAEAVAEKAARMRAELDALEARTEFRADEGELLTTRDGAEVTVVGTVDRVRETKTWLVFEFQKKGGPTVLCVSLSKRNASDLTLDDLQKYEGQELSFRGTVGHYPAGRYRRVFLEIGSLADVVN